MEVVVFGVAYKDLLGDFSLSDLASFVGSIPMTAATSLRRLWRNERDR